MSETRVVVVERNFDYLYDRHYHLSSERDHARATMRATMQTDRLQTVPRFPAMFSDLRHYPRSEVRIVDRDPVPKSVNRNWTGWTAQAGSMLHRMSQIGDTRALLGRLTGINEEPAQVGGRDRARFFRRPVMPYATQLPPDVVLAVNEQQNIYTIGREDEAAPLTRSMATQTMFRDSEVQTDPYTPEYIVRPGEAPEVLTLATLTFGRGLPAGLHEVEMIERARHRRALEEQLPPISDFSQSEKRMRMMEAIEREEWRVREQQIEELQKLRLAVLIKLLRKREETHQEMSNKKLDRQWNRKQKEKEHFFYKLRLKHVKAIRQLLKTRKNVENKHVARDIIADYSEDSSQVWAPLMRTGQFIDRNSERFTVNSRYLSTYNGLVDLEQSLPMFVLNPRISVPKKTMLTNAGFKKRRFREEERLQVLHETLKRKAVEKTKEEKPLRFLERIEKPIPRPPTPTISIPEEVQESTERGIIFLQQILRGRAIQAKMFEGKEKRKELIEELRSTHSLLKNETNIDDQNKAATLNLQHQRILLDHREDRVEEALAAVEGESVADMFDFLSKELCRLQEERKVHAVAMVAERERRIREAEESGLRQVEERRRREQDEIFKQVVKVHQQSVDVYLREIISENVDHVATEMVTLEIEEAARRIDDEAYECEESSDRLQKEGVVADLVHNFLIPEVHKRNIREMHSHCQMRFLYAAHREIWSASEGALHVCTEGSRDRGTRDVDVGTRAPSNEAAEANEDGEVAVDADPGRQKSRSASSREEVEEEADGQERDWEAEEAPLEGKEDQGGDAALEGEDDQGEEVNLEVEENQGGEPQTEVVKVDERGQAEEVTIEEEGREDEREEEHDVAVEDDNVGVVDEEEVVREYDGKDLIRSEREDEEFFLEDQGVNEVPETEEEETSGSGEGLV